MKATVTNKDFRNVNGLMIPFKQIEKFTLDKKNFFHEWTINSIKYDQCNKSILQTKQKKG